jgi:DNA-binding transcriptional LysR family regulator
MNLRRVRHFSVLAETLNFRRAAEKLHMAQPPLTVSIQKLEAELGIQLFIRKSTGVALTPGGHALLAEARKLLFHGEQMHEIAKNTAEGTGGTLRIGFVGSAAYGTVQRLVPLYRARYPGVKLVLREATSLSIVQQIEDKTLDAGLVRVPLLKPTSIALLPLQREAFVAALPRGHRLATKSALNLSDLASETFVMYSDAHQSGLHSAAMLACQHAGFIPYVTQEAVQVQTLLALVESGLGVGLVPAVAQDYMSDRIQYRQFVDFPASCTIGLSLAYANTTESPTATRFRLLATQEYPVTTLNL